MNATRKHPRCKTCNSKIPAHLSHSARYCSRKCAYRFSANKVGRKPLVTAADRFWSNVDKRGPDECWEWRGTINRKYGVISVGGRGSGMTLTHRMSYEIANGPILGGGHVLHSCDNPPCVNPNHLRLSDHAANMRDMAARERASTTKLTAVDVVEIRRLSDLGVTRKNLALKYDVSPSNITFIVARKTWRHVPQPGRYE